MVIKVSAFRSAILKGMSNRGNGEGTISKRRDGRWMARYFVHTAEGRKRKYLYAKTRKEANEKLLAALGRPEDDVVQSRVTVAEWLYKWYEARRGDWSPSIVTRYEIMIRLHLVPALGPIPLRLLTIAPIEDMRDDLARRYKPATVRFILGVLSTALRAAVKRGLLRSNPVTEVSRPKDRGMKMRPITEGDAAKLITAVTGTRREALYAVALKLGLRQGELMGLRWSDYDPARGVLHVERSVSTSSGHIVWGETKSGKVRTVMLDGKLKKQLEAHRALQNRERLASEKWKDEDLIFPNKIGGVHRRTSLMYVFHRDLEEAGLPRIRFHDMRHTAAVIALNHATPINVVAHILGHADPSLTLRRYSHVLSDAQRQARDRMETYQF